MPEAAKKIEQVAEAPHEKVPALDKDVIIELTKPVMAHGDMIKQIKFRIPTGADLMAMGDGYPIVIDWQTGRVTPHPEVMGNMMSVLAEVPPSTIKMLSGADFSTCAFRLMGFFTPGAQAMRS
jgi:Phage tail assembly chaperone proteins, E, or 41 or 14